MYLSQFSGWYLSKLEMFARFKMAATAMFVFHANELWQPIDEQQSSMLEFPGKQRVQISSAHALGLGWLGARMLATINQ